MKRSSRLVILVVAASSFTLNGCGNDQYPPYSSLVKYGVRHDPILRDAAKELGDERYDPDRPGVFPIMKLDDITKPDNPMFAKSADILKREILRDPTKLSAKDREDLDKALESHFGTPANPTVKLEDTEAIKMLKLDDATLAKGSAAYRIHCLHCHGVAGDGRGPTAAWINPHPRDFRQGIFKFQSVDQAKGTQRPPVRGDLMRTLRSGIEGTAMPTFNLLKDEELESLVSYVIHLSLRGSAEMTSIVTDFELKGDTLVRKADEAPENAAASVKLWAKIAFDKWKDAPKNLIEVAPYPWDANDNGDAAKKALAKSVMRGQQLFTADPAHPRSKNANCISCHIDFGRQAKFKFDDWGTLVRPNNFTVGVFRGGRRPVDMFYRIHSGINGSGMIAYGGVGILQAHEEGHDIWDLVNFVSNLSYPGMRETFKIKIN